jgi:hypothetical protein
MTGDSSTGAQLPFGRFARLRMTKAKAAQQRISPSGYAAASFAIGRIHFSSRKVMNGE